MIFWIKLTPTAQHEFKIKKARHKDGLFVKRVTPFYSASGFPLNASQII